ncbi:MAG: ATP-binding protein [Thermoanaerobaculia bacterium]
MVRFDDVRVAGLQATATVLEIREMAPGSVSPPVNGGGKMPEMAVAETVCSLCSGSGWVLREEAGQRFASECGCRKKELRVTKWQSAGIPERYRDCSLTNFDHLNNASFRHAKDVATEFADSYPFVDSGLLFLGNSGTGKTHLAIGILHYVTTQKGRPGLYVDFSNLLMKIQSTFKSDATESKEDVITPYADVELLILDELGATKPSDFARDMLYALLNTRYNRSRVTIATSNFLDKLPSDERGERSARERLEDRIGYRLRSRLHEMCRNVEFSGDDYRHKVLNANHSRSSFAPRRPSQLKRK